MGRHTDAVCKLCRREGMKLYLKGERCDTKCPLDRRENPRNYPPGMHGFRRGKTSEYGTRLREKQKLKRFYGIYEKQFRNLFARATRSQMNTGDALLSLLERRLDNIVYRLGFAISRKGARQFVSHGHILVNGRRCDIPSYTVKLNDVITVKNRPKSRNLAKQAIEASSGSVPDYLERSSEDPPEGRMLKIPERMDIDPNITNINEQLIIEISTR